MALSKGIEFTGTEILQTAAGDLVIGDKVVTVDCYIKVNTVNATKDEAVASVSFAGSFGTVRKTYKFDVSLEGANFIAQAYAHLKSLPEFAGATDC